jgi:hypothetical protein
MFSYLSPEERAPEKHPLRPIRLMVDEALKALSPTFSQLYSTFGRPSIPPEKLLRALLLQLLYTVRSERMLMERGRRNYLHFDGARVGCCRARRPAIEMLCLLRPLRLGRLKHRKIGIVRGLDPVSDAAIAAVTRKRKKRPTFDADLSDKNVFFPEYLDVYGFPDGNFSLVHRGRSIGFGFNTTRADGCVRLFWIKRRDLMRLGNKWQAALGRRAGGGRNSA